MKIVLFEPEIPPNTGNIIRLCANTGFELHLIEPLAFSLDEKSVRRAGLDYHHMSRVFTHKNWQNFLTSLENPYRLLAISTKGRTRYTEASFRDSDILVFGPETRGLPASLLESLPENQRLRIPMLANSRSINLSNAVAIVCFEALRQQDFPQCV
ncbi:MAG: tRNA (uridine(34)/cytosine(34)/5-carboxymethylaminomethyluridine(34)-2'-O)-methyltransferase TrmL [Pseudomonadales bacterium]|nr:tRNA (uridine(34)/cytosine(34)/5-carboxymethylaminomethyluridine(34)-2'-O)-methyltransferase TrmL [Pseudomonadales bacterium]